MSTQQQQPQTKVVRSSRCTAIARAGIATTRDLKNFLGALMEDVVTQGVSVPVANAAINAARVLLDCHATQERFGKPNEGPKNLTLCDTTDLPAGNDANREREREIQKHQEEINRLRKERKG